MRGFLSVLYGVVAYVLFLVAILYAIGFVGGVVVPKTIDSGPPASLAEALAVNLALLGLFAAQHSIMARAWFKRWWTRLVPRAVERTTYVLFASLALLLLYWQWRPLPQPVWSVTSPVLADALVVVGIAGWATLFVSTFLINHFELFGLRQVWARLSGHEVPPPQFRTPVFYKVVRHPIYMGFLLAFWATPVMSAGHLLFAIATTGYILLGIYFEERDLVAHFGDRYRAYREQVRMLVPLPRRKRAGSGATVTRPS